LELNIVEETFVLVFSLLRCDLEIADLSINNKLFFLPSPSKHYDSNIFDSLSRIC